MSLKLVELGHNITVLDTLEPQIHGVNYNESYTFKLIKDKVNFIKGSVNDYNLIKELVETKDIIVHLAAETGTGQSMYNIRNYVDTNITGTAILLEVLRNEKHDVGKLIVASSRSVYGEGKYYCHNHGEVYPKARTIEDMNKK